MIPKMKLTDNKISNSVPIRAVYKSDGTNTDDPNTTKYARVLTDKNTPVSDKFYYIDTIVYEDGVSRSQLARGYLDDDLWLRHVYYKEPDVWTDWQCIKRSIKKKPDESSETFNCRNK